MNSMHRSLRRQAPVRSRWARGSQRGGFTLIEVLVALVIFSLLLAVVFIPMNVGINLFHVGRARSEVQQAGQATLAQIESELSQAVHIYPNNELPGVTTRAPYNRHGGRPYIMLTAVGSDLSPVRSGTVGTCDSTSYASSGSGTPPAQPVSNTSRLDFILPLKNAGGQIVTPVVPSFNQVTYYARRLNAAAPYDPVDNPIVLFRAEYAHRRTSGTAYNAPDMSSALNAATGSAATNDRYPSNCGSNSTEYNRGAYWLAQTFEGEPNLELVSDLGTNILPTSHTLLTPRGMGLIAPRARLATPQTNYTPNTSFLCEDVQPAGEPDGKIDRVTIKMELAQFDGNNAGDTDENGRPSAQSVASQLTIDLPNVR